jgi:hypothetical protein
MDKISELLQKYPKLPMILWSLAFIYLIFFALNIWKDINSDKNIINKAEISTGNSLSANLQAETNSALDQLAGKIADILSDVSKKNRYTIIWYLEWIDCRNLTNSFMWVGVLSYECAIKDKAVFEQSLDYVKNFLSTQNEFWDALYFDSTKFINIELTNNWTVEFKITQGNSKISNNYFLVTKEQEYLFAQKIKNNLRVLYWNWKFNKSPEFTELIDAFKIKYKDLTLKSETNLSATYKSELWKWNMDEMYLNLKNNNNTDLKFEQEWEIESSWKKYRVFLFYDLNVLKKSQKGKEWLPLLKFKVSEAIVGAFILNDIDWEISIISNSVLK